MPVLDDLVARLRAAKYGAIFYQTRPKSTGMAAACWEALSELVPPLTMPGIVLFCSASELPVTLRGRKPFSGGRRDMPRTSIFGSDFRRRSMSIGA